MAPATGAGHHQLHHRTLDTSPVPSLQLSTIAGSLLIFPSLASSQVTTAQARLQAPSIPAQLSTTAHLHTNLLLSSSLLCQLTPTVWPPCQVASQNLVHKDHPVMQPMFAVVSTAQLEGHCYILTGQWTTKGCTLVCCMHSLSRIVASTASNG